MKKDHSRAQIKEDIELLFHQPSRLNIMAELCGTADGLTFSELKKRCALTDGNLSRHLQSLEEGGAVKIKKTFADSKPLTTAFASGRGRESFLEYLSTLEEVLKQAAKRAGCEVKDGPVIQGLLKRVPT